MRRQTLHPDGSVRTAWGRALRLARLRAGLTADGLGDIVHITGRTVLFYETAERMPDDPEIVESFDAALETGGLLRALFDDVMAERATRSITAPAVIPAEEDDVRRRELLGLLGSAALLVPVAERLEALRLGTDDALDPTVTERDIHEWERTAWDYSCQVGTVPGVHLLGDLLTDFAEVERRVRHVSDSTRGRMLNVVGQLAALAAIALIGLGEHRAARRWWRTAMRAADQSGDPNLAAIVRGRQAVLALYDQRPATSVISLAEEGIAAGHGAPRAGVMSGHATVAQAWADLGQHDRAQQALHDLEDLFERLPGDVTGEHDSQWGWAETRLRHVQSYVYMRAGDLPRAQAAQDRALTMYPDYSYQGRTQVLMHRAATVIVGGDPDAGVRYAVQVLSELPEQGRSDALVTKSANDALSLVPRAMRTSPGVREAHELLGITAGEA